MSLPKINAQESVNGSQSQSSFESDNITVKFQVSEKQIIAHVYAGHLTIGEIKNDIGSKFKVDGKYLLISQCGVNLSNEIKLHEICRNTFGIVEVTLQLSPPADDANENGDDLQLDVGVYYSHYTLPEIITVQVPTVEENGKIGTKELVVEIENKSIIKPFLGGHKDSRKDIEYHDAFSQTGPPMERIHFDNMWSRDTQTVEMRTTSDETNYSRATQAFGTATNISYIPSATDYSINPTKYESYEEKVQRERKLTKILLIQRNFRSYMVKKVISEMAAEWRRWDAERRRRDSMLEEIHLSQYKKECVIKTYPKTKEDFDLLYEQVQRWKESQVQQIMKLQSGGPRIAALNCLLDNEIQLLNGIEKQKTILRSKLKDLHEEKILAEMGKPIEWIGYKNMLLQMDSLRTQRVRYLTKYYKQMKMNYDKERRLELLSEISNILTNEPVHYVQHAEVSSIN